MNNKKPNDDWYNNLTVKYESIMNSIKDQMY